MRKITLVIFLLFNIFVNSQWSTDPATPMVVSNATGYQQGPEMISDGVGGWYVFWSDQRNGPNDELYGQRMNGNGELYWESNGKLIVNAPDSSIYSKYPILMDDGTILLAYVASGLVADVLYAIRIDGNGESLWEDPVILAKGVNGELGNIRRFKRLTGTRSGSDVVFAWLYEDFFMSPLGYAFERITLDGTTQFGEPGKALANSGVGQMDVFDDLNGGLVFHWQTIPFSNASPLRAMRVDAQGEPLWGQNITISQGSNDMYFRFSSQQDSSGNFYTAWTDGSYDVRLAATDLNGDFTWSPSPVAVCTQSDEQFYAAMMLHDGYVYVAWSDRRAPAEGMDLYMQKVSFAGEPQWQTDGVPVIQAPSEYPWPHLLPSNNGSVISTFPTLGQGFVAMRTDPDGNNMWAMPTLFCTSDLEPFGLGYRVVSDGSGGVVASWESWYGDIYAARINVTGELGPTGISREYMLDDFYLYPNPASDKVTISSTSLVPGRATATLTDLIGRTVTRHQLQVMQDHTIMHLSPDIPNGYYWIVLEQDGRSYSPVQLCIVR